MKLIFTKDVCCLNISNLRVNVETFQYKFFPILNVEYFVPPRPIEKFVTEKENPLKPKMIEVYR